MIKLYDKSAESGSLPVRGAWIEISVNRTVSIGYWSLPVRGAWIEIITTSKKTGTAPGSLPVRGAWIEISSIRAGESP